MDREGPVNNRLIPRRVPLLAEEQRQAVHDGALSLLNQVGVAVDSYDLRMQLARHPGVSLREGRVCFRPELVEELLSRPKPRPWEPEQAEQVQLRVGCCASHIVDPATDELRPLSWADLVEATRLVDAMHTLGVSGHAPGFPQDVPHEMRALAEYLIGALYCRWGGTFTASCPLRAYDYYLRMNEVMGVRSSLPLYVVSPLRLSGESLAAILQLIDRVDCYSVSSMPVMGATAPILIPAAFMQALAEAFAGLSVLKLLRPDAQVSFDFMVFPMDMKHGSIVYGSPEMSLCEMFRLEMAAFYGLDSISTRSIRSMSKRPDLQAAMERTGSAVAGVLMGSRSFFGAGMLSVDEVFSPEMLVIDREIADYAARFARGIDCGSEAMSVESVLAGVTQGTFIGTEATLRHFRDTYWLPKLSERRMLSGWLAGGGEDMRARARSEVQRLLSAYDFELPREKAKALWELYAKAAHELVGSDGLPQGVRGPRAG
jgi:trimethylamine:corrinoid methyltransferase-like protein